MSLAQDLREEGRRQSLAEVTSLAQGLRQEGLQKGLALGLANEQTMLKKLLERRFGRLSPEFETKLALTTSDQLLLLSDHLLDATTLEKLFEILDEN